MNQFLRFNKEALTLKEILLKIPDKSAKQLTEELFSLNNDLITFPLERSQILITESE